MAATTALVLLDWLLLVVSLLATYLLLLRSNSKFKDSVDRSPSRHPSPFKLPPSASLTMDRERPAYLLPSYIHHARMLPKESTHMFRYPTLYLAVPLTSLERQRCNLGWGNRLFRWNPDGKGGRRSALTALEASDYLGAGEETSWLLKLNEELSSRGVLKDRELLNEETPYEVWAITMPSLAGIHGINPLTVYYIYRNMQDGTGDSKGPCTDKELYICLLEVHNTFSERHLYILPTESGEDDTAEAVSPQSLRAAQGGSSRPKGEGLSWRVDRRRVDYDHQWTFPRSFHVSPFNDRGGYYRLYLKSLWKEGSLLPQMDVRLLLLVPEEGTTDASKQPVLHKKILATLSSYPASSARRPLPLKATNLLFCLSRQPFDLLLTFFRIVYQATKLHYTKKLDVFGKPDMTVATADGRLGGQKLVVPEVRDFDGQGWPMPSNATQIERLTGAAQVGRKKGTCEEEAEQGPTDGVRVPKNGSLYWPAPTFIDQAAKERFVLLARQSPSISVRLVGSDGKVETISSREATRGAEAKATATATGKALPQCRNDGDTFDDDEVDVQQPNPSSVPPFSRSYMPSAKDGLLTIYLMSPAFYSDIILYPSPRLALLLGARVGRRWGVNDFQLWHTFWDDLERDAEESRCRVADEGGDEIRANKTIEKGNVGDVRGAYGKVYALRTARAKQVASVRRKHHSWAQSMSLCHQHGRRPSSSSAPPLPPAYCSSPLDSHPILPPLSRTLLFSINLLYWSSLIGERVFRLLGARYQSGTEPWLEWARGQDILHLDDQEADQRRAQATEGEKEGERRLR